ncbi:carbohydrate ABC transporter substrate-binding protein [Porcincola intestinalis]|uniref:carbohydrate ABC transporter substrate-binding protein n=1 Tax=Porcincola intestinalis TaxID=2606632 RepID=UPI002A81A4D8|nr:carbohydrate ABC transporter substrate-binding protein [Porcincola intestinalis]MCI6698381.1 carbohydrate ABC transporter substrate-binding protein [Lachnospiraceae bacterium]MDY4205348.1 carbohydrate ABC transporter substrate-binding protein [Porcincola intestinalis]MDY5580024.1 carbohydrate ABC transporter substrate-binding protein [Porcincola intestinalis]
MKKRMMALVSMALAGAMVLPMAAMAGETEAAAAAADEGKVLNIEVWNEEFKSRITDHYPGYEKTDDTHGKIGDVTVNWIITPNDDNAYQNNLDTVLPGNADASADDKVDMFLIEADYAKKYIDADANVAMPLKDLGITSDNLSKQYKYTQDVVTDANGDLRGTSWQACSAGLIYNRAAAKEVLGTDDPAEVQKAVADWDTYNETAKKMADAGYLMQSTVNDTYRVYSNNVSGPWVQDGKVVVDDNIKKWVDDSKAQVDAKETTTAELWSDDWSKGFYPDGKVFCYFGPAWLINFSMKADDEKSIAAQGGWGLVNGPQGFFWGGTWICAAQGTDNPSLVKDIMLKMTTDDDIMKEIAQKDSDCVNNKEVLKALASDDSGSNKVLGGQNPYQMLADGAEKVDMSNISIYDQGCNEEFQKAMKNYFDGNASYDDALAQFKSAIVEKYPELTTD